MDNVEDVSKIKNDCILDFLSTSNSSTYNHFYTIDRLLQTDQDELTAEELLLIEDYVSQPNDDITSSKFEQWLTQNKPSDKSDDIIKAESKLEQVEETCSIETIWKEVYAIQIKQMSNRDLSQFELLTLETVSTLCPSDYGQVVYIARGIAGVYTGYRYTALDCEQSSDVNHRSKEDIVSKGDLVVSPNPVVDKLTILIESNILEVTILDLAGHVQLTIQGGSSIIDVASLNQGLYLVQVITEDQQTYVQKFIKQ